MQTKALYTERPAPIHYMELPTGAADLWLRKNITEVTDPETGAVGYEADEAYMRTNATEAEVQADFEGFYTLASAWEPPVPPKPPTPEERITALEEENAELREQLNTTMEAVDFLLFNGEEV